MRRILTSLPYEKRIGLPSAANGLSLTDSVRRTLLTPVADSQLDVDAESASGKLVRCDASGSLLADMKLRGYSEQWKFTYPIFVNDGVTPIQVFLGYEHLEFHRVEKAFITSAHICDAAGNSLQNIPVNKMTPAKGVRWKCYLLVIGIAGGQLDIVGYHYR